jgi:hypothetical protein
MIDEKKKQSIKLLTEVIYIKYIITVLQYISYIWARIRNHYKERYLLQDKWLCGQDIGRGEYT